MPTEPVERLMLLATVFVLIVLGANSLPNITATLQTTLTRTVERAR